MIIPSKTPQFVDPNVGIKNQDKQIVLDIHDINRVHADIKCLLSDLKEKDSHEIVVKIKDGEHLTFASFSVEGGYKLNCRVFDHSHILLLKIRQLADAAVGRGIEIGQFTLEQQVSSNEVSCVTNREVESDGRDTVQLYEDILTNWDTYFVQDTDIQRGDHDRARKKNKRNNRPVPHSQRQIADVVMSYLQEDDMGGLKKYFKLSCVEYLNLSGRKLNQTQIKTLLLALCTSHVTSLDVSNCGLGDNRITVIFKLLRILDNKVLTNIKLVGNPGIAVKGKWVAELKRISSNGKLRSVEISSAEIDAATIIGIWWKSPLLLIKNNISGTSNNCKENLKKRIVSKTNPVDDLAAAMESGKRSALIKLTKRFAKALAHEIREHCTSGQSSLAELESEIKQRYLDALTSMIGLMYGEDWIGKFRDEIHKFINEVCDQALRVCYASIPLQQT